MFSPKIGGGDRPLYAFIVATGYVDENRVIGIKHAQWSQFTQPTHIA